MVRTMKPATKGAVAIKRREARSLRDPLRNQRQRADEAGD
jgi:hypothetical protein